MKKRLFETLNDLGMRCNLRGRKYIEYAVEIASEFDDLSITRDIYAAVGERFGTTGAKVERSIRYAINSCFLRASFDEMFSVFGNAIDADTMTISNGAFIFGLAKYIEFDGGK